MADFPWEDFQTNNTATVEKGPWEDFAAQKPRFKKTRAQVTAEVEKAQAARPVEQMSGLESVAAGAYEPARWASLQPVVQGLENVLSVPINDFMSQAYGPKRPPFVIDRNVGTLTQAEGTVPHYVPGTPLVNVPFAHPEQNGLRQVSPLPRALSQVAEGLMTPGNLALLSAGGTRAGQQGLATVFGPQMAVGAVEETGQALDSQLPVDERQTAAYRAAINAVMAGLAGKTLTDGFKPQGPEVLVPDEVLPPLAPRQNYVPAQRQLVEPEPITIDVAPPTQIPLTSASTLAERNNPQPFGQVIRSQEPIDPTTYRLGRENVRYMTERAGGDFVGPERQLPLVGQKTLAELNQPKPNVIEPVPGEGREIRLTPQPEALRSIVRQSVEEAMGRLISNEKRPSQESPVVLGGQQTQAPMVYGPRPVPMDVKVEEGRAFTLKAEVEGGKLPTSGQEFSGQIATPGFLKTAEQKLTAKGEVTPTKVSPMPEAGTPLVSVTDKINRFLQQRDTVAAIEATASKPAVVKAKTLDQLREIGRERVPLSAAERIIFDQTWDKVMSELNPVKEPVVSEPRLATKQDQQAAPIEEYNYRLDPDAVSKMGPAEFKEKMGGFTQDALTLGDKIKGNAEQIAKLEQHQAAATAEFKQALQEGRMDDAMILSTKPQYFREALEIAKGTAPESAQKKLAESKGMSVKAAQEKASKQRGETGAIFPEGNEGRKPKKLSFEEESKLISFYDQFSAKIEERANAMAKVGAEWFKKAELKVGDIMYTKSGTPIKILDGYVRFPTRIEKGKGSVNDFTKPMVFAEQVGPYKGSDEMVGQQGRYYLDQLSYDRPSLGSGIKSALDKNKESGSIINPFNPETWRDFFSSKEKKEKAVGGVQKLPSYDEVIKRAQTPQGFGKLGKHVGGLLDPRAKAVGNETAHALIAWHSQVGMGNSMAALWAESRKRLGDITVDKDGTITLANGRKGYMSDVFEAEIEKSGSQPLTPEQKQAVEFWKRVLKDTAAEQKAEGVKGFKENEEMMDLDSPYFTRPAIGRKDIKSKDQPGKVAVGSERYYQKSREYPTEEMGAKDGIVYEPSFLGRVAHYLKEHYRAIADERLATHLEKLSTNEWKFMVNSLTYHPAFRGRYFSNLAKETINKSLDKPSHTFQKLSNALQDFKKYRFSTDAGYLFNQMLPTLFVSPKSWAIAAKESIKAFGSEKALSNYLANKENLQAAQAIVKGGGNIANVWEFIGGSEKKGWVDKIGPIRGSGRAMGVALDVAKIELYKALKPVAEKNGWNETELVEQIGNMVFSASSKSIGVTESRALAERMLFNAPNYLRATANLLAGITELHKNSATGGIARRALIGVGAAIMIQFTVIYKLMVDSGTMDDKEMEDRLNPMKPQFLKLPVRVPMGKEGGLEGSADDKMIDVSYGNILMGIARSIGSLGAIIVGEKEGAVLGQDNPGIKFFSARLSPWLAILKKIETGKDYRGKEQNPARLIAEEMVPLIVTPLLTEGAGSKVGWADAGMTGLGFNTTVESRGARQKRLEGEYAQQVYKAPIDKLNVAQRRNATVMAEMALAGEEKEGPSLYSLEAPQKRAEKVTSLLSDESRAMLEQAKLKVPNVIATQTEDKKPLKLNKEEQGFYVETYAKELDRRLSNIKRAGSVVNKKRFESITQSVGEFSWTQTKRLINTRAREESTKQR